MFIYDDIMRLPNVGMRKGHDRNKTYQGQSGPTYPMTIKILTRDAHKSEYGGCHCRKDGCRPRVMNSRFIAVGLQSLAVEGGCNRGWRCHDWRSRIFFAPSVKN